jgi:long-chain fatty acid transport protein
MKKTLRFLTAAALVSAAAPALATNGMRMIGFSPVQNGMGGVGVGATLDGGAVLTNPAGITELGPRLDIAVTTFKPTVKYTADSPNQSPGGPIPFVASPGTEFESNRGASFIPNLGVVIPLGGGFTAGLGAFGVGGMGVDYDANLYNGVTLTSYQQLRVAPAIAYKVNDMFSAGVTLNAMWGQMKYDVAGGAPFGQALHDTANSFGIGATVGLKFTPVKDLTFGLAYETKSSFQDYEFDVAGGTRLTPVGPVAFPAGVDKLAFDQPAVASGGVAWKPTPALVVAADVQWINWSDVMGAGLPKYSNDISQTGAQPFNMTWDDQVVVKVGGQFQATKELALRLGYDYGKNPLTAGRAFENIAFPAVAEHHVTAGVGYAVSEKLVINVAGMFSPETKLSGANLNEQGISAYQTSMSQFSIDVGVAWQF